MLAFEWDDEKSDRNVRLRGYGFEFAVRIFGGATVEWEDRRRDYRETRMIAVGKVAESFLTVVYSVRGERRRVIASWPSNRKERARWRE